MIFPGITKVKTPRPKPEKRSEPIYACIKNGVVQNCIVSDPPFIEGYVLESGKVIEGYKTKWDACVDITKLEPRPAIGWLYDSETGQFTDPNPPKPKQLK